MILSDMLNRVLVIDDKEEETRGLRDVMETDDVAVDYADPFKLAGVQFARNRQLIFMDLMLDGDINHLKTNISRIINILRNNIATGFGLYGLVVWTSHENEVEQLKTAIGKAYKADLEGKNLQAPVQIDGAAPAPIKPIVPPLFIVSLDKSKYNQEGYGSLLADLESALSQNPAAYFFTSWYGSVIKGVRKSVHDIYKLVPEYPKQKDELKYLLYELGNNHVGVGKGNDKLTEDSFKAFDELLAADLNSQQRSSQDLFNPKPQKQWGGDTSKKMKISALLNAKLFVDTENLSSNLIVPGNVYKVLNADSPLVVQNKHKDLAQFNLQYENVAIELTPPCDFSHKKVHSRLIGGFAFEASDLSKQNLEDISDALSGDKTYNLWLAMIGGRIMIVSFDFRHLFTPLDADLKDTAQYQLWFRAKPRLFADVLQKFSSHAARLGLANIDLV